MKIGFTADTYKKISLQTVLRIYRFLGLDHIEVTSSFIEAPFSTQKLAQKRSLGLHLPNVGNRGYDLSSVQYQSLNEKLVERIKTGSRAIPFEYALFHPPETEAKDQDPDLLIELLHHIPIPLVVENLKSCSGEGFLSFLEFCRSELGEKLAGICLDIPHAHLAGENWKTLFDRLAEDVRVIHLSNCRFPEDSHYPFGLPGDLNLVDIFVFLNSRNFRGILNFEVKPPTFWHIKDMLWTLQESRRLLR